MSADVLIVSEAADETADLVATALAQRGASVRRFDTADFPARAEFAATAGTRWSGWLRARGREVGLDGVGAVYYRRPCGFEFPAGMSEPERRFAAAEARLGLGGLLASLPCRWVNHPFRIGDAEFKPIQLATAARCGLRIPATLLTNSAGAAAEFAGRLGGRLVYKTLSPGIVSEAGTVRLLYTTPISADELRHDGIGLTANLFQEFVWPKRFDVRVAAVGAACFAVAIRGGSDRARVDWRSDYGALTYQVIALPATVRDGIGRYLREFGLTFGAFDFAVGGDGDYYFLECNPNGQWAWLEEETGIAVSSALADALLGGRRDG